MSLEISVKLTGSEAVMKLLRNKGDKINDAMVEAITHGAMAIIGDAKKNCPVDTGRLRNSITSEIKKNSGSIVGKVGTNVKYAPHVEYGFKKHLAPIGNEWLTKHGFPKSKKGFLFVKSSGVRFLYNAYMKNFSRINIMIKNAVEGAVGK